MFLSSVYAPASMYSRQHDHFEFLGCDALDLAVSRFLDTESLEDVSCLLYGSFQPSLKASHQSFSFSAPSMAALPPLTHPKSALKSTPAPGSSPPALEDDVSSQQSPVALASRGRTRSPAFSVVLYVLW